MTAVLLAAFGVILGSGGLTLSVLQVRRAGRRDPEVGATAWAWLARGAGLVGLGDRLRWAADLLGVPGPKLARQVARASAVGAAGGLASGVLGMVTVAPAELLGALGLVGIGVVAGGSLGAGTAVVGLVRRAERVRQGMVEATGAYLDLVGLHLAGGAGLEQSLTGAASALDHDLGRRLRVALEAAARRGEAPWEALARVGATVDSPSLVELATAVTVAGTEGAQIRRSLAAKARSLRQRQLAEVEAAERAAGERLFVPSSLLLLGFLVLVGYPALARILHGL
ncbi:type II secretion system F family protein [Aciditerrimonas ferrireducens]|jgi:Flp pilus assembly protein TadB|uniref:type II secretion system F family protein n=1 Tax=Aciditerrimonas ferrireducens TaxID=667306 RepID=UPI002004AEAA|nr:type II secretion system F family protein [Aciditerrimonas ferrireducens]MCK4176569.1 type II secretion system F family protein [Aciditerrimonas ferrireducens]